MAMNMPKTMSGVYGGLDDPCILGHTNGTYPNGTIGKGSWKPFGIYMPLAAEKAACQAPNDPWDGTVFYGWWTTYFIVIGLAALAVCNVTKGFHNMNRIHGLPGVAYFPLKVSALFRLVSYPQLRVFRGGIPPLGPSILLFGFLLFSTAVTFLRWPYYRPPNFGSSPLGLRSEWIALASVPWIYAAASKRNFLVLFSGVSFQRIMTFHKWVPWVVLYMSIVHAWSMIIRANRQQPWWYTFQTNPWYWTGFPPLVALAWLCVMSFGPIRNRFYETFYFWHIIAAVFFFVWMYVHTNQLLNSWQYLHATAAIWGAGFLWRSFVFASDHGWFTRIPRASIESLPGDAILVRIPMPRERTWSAGSHVYLRFLNLRFWESHPFTISSLPAPRPTGEKLDAPAAHEMVFLIRPHAGMTARLQRLALASSTPTTRACLVDGPYGGFIDSLRACNTVILVAGGSGMSVMIPIAQALSRAGAVPGVSCCTQVQAYWAIRDVGCLEWFKHQLKEVQDVSVYLTNSAAQEEKPKAEAKADDEEINLGSSVDTTPDTNLIRARPDLPALLTEATQKFGGRIGVVVCGPSSMVLDVRNTVAALQKKILMSNKDIACKELELYEDSFDS